MAKLKILVVPSDNFGGVGFYRSKQPHEYLAKMFPEDYEIIYDAKPNWKDKKYFEQFDIIHVHKGLFGDMKDFYETIFHLKDTDTVTIMDIDDSWDLSETHPQYILHKQYKLDKIITNNLQIFDYVTTTTDLFAKEIYKYNKHVLVFPNAIDPEDERFKITKAESDKVRIGMVMGSAHEYDVKLIDRFVKRLSPETLSKIQIVLCGFDLRGVLKEIDSKTGQQTERTLAPEETVWYRYEQMLTDNYSIVSPDYRKYLSLYLPGIEYSDTDKECYRRCWTKDINHYFSHYENIDILLAPLHQKMFNYVKSELKAIECCFSDTALIASEYGPYSLTLTNALNDDGSFNDSGNAILISNDKGVGDWAKAIEMLVNDTDKLDALKRNIHNDFKERYSLKTVTDNRDKFYKRITKYSKK